MTESVHEDWKPRALEGFVGLIGPLLTRRENGAWAYAIRTEVKHANPAGIVHGGLLTSLLDHALSVIAWEANERRACITVALDVHFLAAARPGDLVVARGRVVRTSASLVFMQGSLTVDDQEVATGTAIMKIR